MIFYSQSLGDFTLPNGTVLDGCYSGGGTVPNDNYRNTPDGQSLRDLGTIPQGQYTISPAHTVPGKGPCVMSLTPNPDNEMYGRSGFLIHGDNPSMNFTASDGCIVCGPAIRQQIADLVAAGEDQLTVTS
jgi:hypothetical protein